MMNGMMDFITSSYVSAAFLLLYGLILIWAASPSANIVKQDTGGLMTWKKALLILSFFYLSLAFTNVYVAQGSALFLTNQAGCENLLQNQTEDTITNTTTFEYSDSCQDRTVPKAIERTFMVLSWVVFFNFIFFSIGIFALIAGALLKW